MYVSCYCTAREEMFLVEVWCLVVVVVRLTKGVKEGDVFQVRDLESYPLYSRCRVRDRW